MTKSSNDFLNPEALYKAGVSASSPEEKIRLLKQAAQFLNSDMSILAKVSLLEVYTENKNFKEAIRIYNNLMSVKETERNSVVLKNAQYRAYHYVTQNPNLVLEIEKGIFNAPKNDKEIPQSPNQERHAILNMALANLNRIVGLGNELYWKSKGNPQGILAAKTILQNHNLSTEEKWEKIVASVNKSREGGLGKSMRKGIKYLAENISILFSKKKKKEGEYSYRHPKTQELYEIISKASVDSDFKTFNSKLESFKTDMSPTQQRNKKNSR